MEEMKMVLTGEEVCRVEKLSARLGISPEEFLRRGLIEYLDKLEAEPDFDPVGFGLWKDRDEMRDSTKWVRDHRDREWTR